MTKGEDNDAQQDDEPRRGAPRADSRSPRSARSRTRFPSSIDEVKLSDYDKIIQYIKATCCRAPSQSQTVAIFTENEQIDYMHEAKEAKGDPAALKRIGAEMVETWKKREKAIKGEK